MMARILVADDEESIRFTFVNFLEGAGHSVETAASCAEAISRLDAASFDLIFADILLGDRTGIDFLREVRARRLGCPVVMITGFPNIETASEAVRLGAFDYIPKPVLYDTVLHVTGTALKHKLLIDEKERYRTNLEAIFRSIKDAIITVDRDLRVLEMNDVSEKLCGFARTEAIGRPLGSVSRGCNGSCIAAVKETLSTGKHVELNRVECQHSGRLRQVVNIVATPLRDSSGAEIGAVMVLRDETRLAELEFDLKGRTGLEALIGKSRPMQQVYSLIELLADVQSTVLISGESGTGKELVADAIHHHGVRRDRPLVKVNCTALSENLLESELFGHVRGAFTGAIRDKMGRFELANSGTIFLDEIGDVSPALQAKLLRVLQERVVERVGSTTPVRVDVRVIAATNSDLAAKVKKGQFREDLYFRLKVVQVVLPPLRERKDDIPLLVEHFLRRFNLQFKKEVAGLTDDALKTLFRYRWPGNVRELEHVMERAVLLCRNSMISTDDLPDDLLADGETAWDTENTDANAASDDDIRRALEKAGWNKAKAARMLGIGRRTLYRKIEEFGIRSPEAEV